MKWDLLQTRGFYFAWFQICNSGLGLLGKQFRYHQISIRFLTVSVACKGLEMIDSQMEVRDGLQ